jgi:hypothetical protein
MANEYKTWPVLGDFHKNIKTELLRRKKRTFGGNNKPRAVWVRAVSNAVISKSITAQEHRAGKTGADLRRDINIMVGGLLRPSGATRGGFEPVYQRVAKGRELLDRPMPGIESISVVSKGEFGSLRKITITWMCPSIEDLDILMPYWLSPGISVMVEWGWSNIGQIPVGINIDDASKMAELYQFPAKIMKDVVLRQESNDGIGAGNQDFFIGIITNFTWNMNEDGTFTCTTELTTFGETMLALNLNKDVKKEGIEKDEKDKVLYSIREYVEKAFNKENLESIMSSLDDERNIIKTDPTEANYGVSFFGSITAPLVTVAPGKESDIYMTWKFIEENIVNFHVCPIIGESKGEDSTYAFQMDSSNTKVSNDEFLYSRDSEILINNNKNTKMIFFDEAPKDYDAEKYGTINANKDGFLRNVYVKRSLVVDTFQTSETLGEAIKTLLNKIRNAVFDLWDLRIQTNALGESRSEVIDQKYVSEKGFQDVSNLLSNEPETNDAIFNFGGYSGESILRGISFTSKMTNQVALTHFFGRNKAAEYERTVYSDDSDVGIKSIYGSTVDRVLMNLRFQTGAKLKEEEKTEEEKGTVETNRIKEITFENRIEWKKQPTDKELFYYTDENDIKLVDQYLRRKNQQNITKNIPVYPLEISVTIDGISGVLPGNIFTLDNLPKLFKDSGVFQVVEISHEVSSDDWTTTLRAFFRPVDALEAGKEKIIEPKQADIEPEDSTADKDYIENEPA